MRTLRWRLYDFENQFGECVIAPIDGGSPTSGGVYAANQTMPENPSLGTTKISVRASTKTAELDICTNGGKMEKPGFRVVVQLSGQH